MSKYKFTGETKSFFGIELNQIMAVVDFGDVRTGDVGGWIESENNLSQFGNAWVSGNARVSGDARVSDNARVSDDARVYGDARVSGNACVYGNAYVYGNARVSDEQHILVIGPVGSRNDFTTFFKTNRGISVKCGCFQGDLNDFLSSVERTHGDSCHGKVYRLAAEMAKVQINES